METKADEKQLITIERSNALEVFTSESKLTSLIDQVKQHAASLVPDVKTAKGRSEITSLAYAVTRTKTYLDAIGKDLVTEYKELPKKIDAGRKYARDCLDALKDEIRAPLDAWEAEQEKLKIQLEIMNAYDQAHLDHETWKLARQAEIDRREAERVARDEAIRVEAMQREREAQKEDQERLKREFERELAEKERQKQEALERARLEALAAVEREKAKQREAELIAEREKQALIEAENKRLADKQHTERVQKQAIESLVIWGGFAHEEAQRIIHVIASGLVDNVTINY